MSYNEMKYGVRVRVRGERRERVKEVKMERLARLDLAYQAAECALADAYTLQAKVIGEVTLQELETANDNGDLDVLYRARTAIAWLAAMRRKVREARDCLAEEEEARRA